LHCPSILSLLPLPLSLQILLSLLVLTEEDAENPEETLELAIVSLGILLSKPTSKLITQREY